MAAGGLPHAAQAAAAGGFDDRRRAIFQALAAAYDGEGPIKAGRRNLLEEMAQRYAQGSAEYRAWVEALLDALDLAPAKGRFTERAVGERRELLRGWLRATESADKLLHRPRPSDANEPATLIASNEMNVEAIKKFMATIPDDQKKLDPVTGLLKYRPAKPDRRNITDGLSSTGTPVRLRRQLSHSAYVLIVSFFIEDTRYVTVEAFA